MEVCNGVELHDIKKELGKGVNKLQCEGNRKKVEEMDGDEDRAIAKAKEKEKYRKSNLRAKRREGCGMRDSNGVNKKGSMVIQ